jgi:hypothetical protein
MYDSSPQRERASLSSSDPSAAQLLACLRNDCLSKSSDRYTSCPAPRASTAPRTGPVLLSTLQLLKVQGSPTRHLAGSSAPTPPRASAGSPALHASASAAVVSHICGTLSRGFFARFLIPRIFSTIFQNPTCPQTGTRRTDPL